MKMSLQTTTVSLQTADEFRVAFPEFQNKDEFSDGVLLRNLTLANNETGSSRWGRYEPFSLKEQGMFLFTAHNLVKRREAAVAVQQGVSPYPSGPPKKVAVGDESIDFGLNRPIDYTKDSDLSSTIYGAEFIRLRERVGMGATTAAEARTSYYGMYPGYGFWFFPYYS